MILVFLEARVTGRSQLFLILRNLGKQVLFIQACLPKMVMLLSCIQAAVQVYPRFVPSFNSLCCSIVLCCICQQEDKEESCFITLSQLPALEVKELGYFFFFFFFGFIFWVAGAQFECGQETPVICLSITYVP